MVTGSVVDEENALQAFVEQALEIGGGGGEGGGVEWKHRKERPTSQRPTPNVQRRDRAIPSRCDLCGLCARP